MTPASTSVAELPSEKYERALAFRNGLLALCEGRGNMDDAVYRSLRREFMADPDLSDFVPQFIRTAPDTVAMWASLRGHSPQWEPRRQFVREQLSLLIEKVEDIQIKQTHTLAERDPARYENGMKPMYNLFVSGRKDAWDGDPWTIEASRCVNEYTDDDLIKQYGSLDGESKEALKKLPCIFAHESSCYTSPKFGLIRDIVKRQGQVRIEYEIIPVDRFITDDDLSSMLFELDIGKWELNRTHWAVKEVNLAKELHARGVALPNWVRSLSKSVDISVHNFDVALSFPGEARGIVDEVARHLENLVGPNAYFYDKNYVSQLARPSLDVLLQDIYRNRAKLIVVFLSSNYQKKNWCGIEFRAIRDIIAERELNRIMFIRTDDGSVDGVFNTDGYVDARIFDAANIARFVKERVDLL